MSDVVRPSYMDCGKAAEHNIELLSPLRRTSFITSGGQSPFLQICRNMVLSEQRCVNVVNSRYGFEWKRFRRDHV